MKIDQAIKIINRQARLLNMTSQQTREYVRNYPHSVNPEVIQATKLYNDYLQVLERII